MTELPKLPRVTFVTSNIEKFIEVEGILRGKFDVSRIELNLTETQTLDLREIVEKKAQDAYSELEGPVLVEDTSLSFDAWNGLPGPFIKWFLEKVGVHGILGMLNAFSIRKATATAIFAYCDEGGVQIFEGSVRGKIPVIPSGDFRFGWDPIFIPGSHIRTFAMMTRDKKNEISHRRKALDSLVQNIKLRKEGSKR